MYGMLYVLGNGGAVDEVEVGVKRKRHNEKWYKCKVSLEFILGRYFDYSEMNLCRTSIRKSKIEEKVCALCWKENPYIRFYWRDGLYTVCHKHGVLLRKVEGISYSAHFDEIAGVVGSKRVHGFINCGITRSYLVSLGDKGCTLGELLLERKIANDESVLWPRVVRFLKERFLIEFGFDDVFEFVDRQYLAGLSVVGRLEKVRKYLIDIKPESQKLINVVVLTHIVKHRLFSHSFGEKNWLLSEAYSVHPVLYVYIAGLGKHLFVSDGAFKKSELPKIYIEDFSDRKLCKFILESSIFSPGELENFYHGGKDYSGGWSEAPGVIDTLTYNYKVYLVAAGKNIFDLQPLQRTELIG